MAQRQKGKIKPRVCGEVAYCSGGLGHKIVTRKPIFVNDAPLAGGAPYLIKIGCGCRGGVFCDPLVSVCSVANAVGPAVGGFLKKDKHGRNGGLAGWGR